MGWLGDDYPKALLPVGNEPLIRHHLRLLHELGVREVFVVVGYRGTDVMQAVDDETFGLKVQFVEQGRPLGSAHALGRLRPHVRAPFLLTLGDYYLSCANPGRMLERLQEGSSAIAAKREPETQVLAEACELRVDEHARIVGITEKPAVPHGDIKGCGFYALQPTVFDAVARTPRTALRDEYELTVALELYIDRGEPVFAEEVICWDRNMTHPQDVLECNLQWLVREEKNELVGDGALVEVGARLDRAVIGRGARIPSGLSLKEVVVFPSVCCTGSEVLRRALVTSRGILFVGEDVPSSDPHRSQITSELSLREE
jgi:dTDP-glucose pyrophosphorylase